MRKIYLFILLFCIQMSLVAQEAVIEAKVHLTEPGKLSATLREQGYSLGSVTKLIVTGKFDQRDFSSMKMQMGSLHYVDISGTDVTEIPAEAMREKSGLTHFFAPKSVRKIGGSAFYNCYQLQQIPFDPMSIDSIGSYAFSSCYNMKGDLNFSDKLFYIGSDAFYSSGITSVDMSASERINYLNGSTFRNCSSLKKVILAPSITSLSWGDFQSCHSLQQVVLPRDLTSLGSSTFSSCSSLTEIDLSVCKNLSNIESDVFNSCTGLCKVILPESLRYLSTPFSGCSNLRDIVVKASTVPSIQEMTFGSVNWDEAKLFVPVGTKGEYEKAQHWNLFYDIFEIGLMVKHNAGGQVKYKSGVISNNQVVFHDALETRFDIIPNDGYVIKSVRFLGNEQTPSDHFIVPAGTENGVLDIEFALRPFAIQVQIQGEGTVRADELNITNGMTVMADSSEMKRFIIHPAPGYILNELTFNGQTNIVQQDSVYVTPVIHGDATLNIQFASESEAGKAHKLHFTIGENGRVDYMNTPLLPQTTISIKEGDAPVFTFHPESTYRVASVRLNGEELVSQLHENQLTLPALTQTSQLEILFDVDPVVSVHLSTAGTLQSMLLPHQYPIVKDLRLTGELNEYDFSFIRHQLAVLQKLDIEQTQVSYQSIPHFLPYEALREKSTLKTILLPITLDSIGSYAFYNCTNLVEVNWDKLENLQSIGSYAFQSCSTLENVSLESLPRLKKIGVSSFEGCGRLSTITIPQSVISIGNNAFGMCENMIDAKVLPTPPPVLTSGIFGSNLTLLFVPGESVEAYRTANIWSGYNCISMDAKPVQVHVPAPGRLAASLTAAGHTLTDIFSLAITGDLNAEDFRIMNKSMSSLIEVDLSKSAVTAIPANAFDGKTTLKRVLTSRSISTIGDKAFNSCRLLETIPFADSIQSIGSNAFDGCSNLSGELIFPRSLTSIGSYAFHYCSKITKIDFSAAESLSYISEHTFQDCRSLSEINWGKNIQSIGSYAFNDIALAKLNLLECKKLNSIGGSAFSSCRNLNQIILPNSDHLSFNSYTFSYSPIKTIVVLSSRTPSISETTFSGIDYNRTVLYVPTGSAKKYGLTSIWATFTKIEEVGIQTLIGNNGSLLLNGNRLSDQTVLFDTKEDYTFTLLPDPGYVIDSLWINQELQQSGVTEVTILAGTRSASVRVAYALRKFGMHIRIDGSGRVKMGDRLLASGETLPLDSCSMLPLIISPETGYEADTIRFNQMGCVLQLDSVYMTPPVTEASELHIRFVPQSEMGQTYRIATQAGRNGRIEYCNTPLIQTSSVKVKAGDRAKFVFIPEAGYLVDRVLINGTDVSNQLQGNHLLTEAVSADMKIDASYKVNPVLVIQTNQSGQLQRLINADQRKGVSELTIKGMIGSYEFEFLRDSMEVLSVLDLREARIGDNMGAELYYTDEIPSNAFSKDYSQGKKTLTAVYLPKETRRICSNAFRHTSNLHTINWEDLTKLEGVDYEAFSYSGISNVVLPETLKELRERVFYSCSKLQSVDLSQTQLKQIEQYVLHNCSQLTEVKLPATVTEIGNSAFSSNNRLQQINLEDCALLKRIGEGAFSSCGIDSLRLAASVKEIGNSAFNYNTRLVSADLSNLKELKVLSQSIFGSCSDLRHIVLPPNVITIESSAFSGSGLTGTLVLPESVTTIGDQAFHAPSLKFCKVSVTTPPVLGSSVFSSESLIGIFVPESALATYEAHPQWGQYTLLGGERHVTVHVQRGGELAQQIMDQAKVSPATVTHLTVTGTLNETDFGGLRTNMTVLYNLDISKTDVTHLPDGAFRDKRILMTIQLPEGLRQIGNNAFMNCKGLQDTLMIPQGVDRIGDYAFQYCSDLYRVELPASLTEIGSYAFEYCHRLTQDICFPKDVRTIGYQAFNGCRNLNGLIQFSEALTNLSSNAFQGCTNIKKVDFSRSAQLQSIPGYCFASDSTLTEIILPPALRTIQYYAFQGCSRLDNILFPQTLQSIDGNAFEYNYRLTKLDFSNCSQLNQIGSYAFRGCRSLISVNLPVAMSHIGERAFAGCTALANISVENQIPATMNDQVFEGVKTRSCVLSIPTAAYYQYLTAEQWGQFVQMRKAIDVGVSQGGTVEYIAAIKEDDQTLGQPVAFTLSQREAADKGAILRDASTIYLDENEEIRFVINPEIENGSMKVLYNNVDVTHELQGNTYVATGFTAERGNLVVNFDIESEMTIQVAAAQGGQVSGGGKAVYGETILVKATPDFGYRFIKWTNNGVEVSQEANYSFKAIQSVQLLAHFEQFVSQLGDANGDDRVNISDVVATVDFIIGKNPQAFIFEAADINQDGRVNISDVVAIVDLILNPRQLQSANETAGNGEVRCSRNGNTLEIETQEPVFGFEFTYEGALETLPDLAGFDVTLYEKDGKQRLLAYTASGKGLSDTQALFRVDARTQVEEVLFVDRKGRELALTGDFDAESPENSIRILQNGSQLQIESADPVKMIEIYDLGGRRVKQTTQAVIDTHTFGRATYIIRVVTEKEELRTKMILGNRR